MTLPRRRRYARRYRLVICIQRRSRASPSPTSPTCPSSDRNDQTHRVLGELMAGGSLGQLCASCATRLPHTARRCASPARPPPTCALASSSLFGIARAQGRSTAWVRTAALTRPAQLVTRGLNQRSCPPAACSSSSRRTCGRDWAELGGDRYWRHLAAITKSTVSLDRRARGPPWPPGAFSAPRERVPGARGAGLRGRHAGLAQRRRLSWSASRGSPAGSCALPTRVAVLAAAAAHRLRPLATAHAPWREPRLRPPPVSTNSSSARLNEARVLLGNVGARRQGLTRLLQYVPVIEPVQVGRHPELVARVPSGSPSRAAHRAGGGLGRPGRSGVQGGSEPKPDQDPGRNGGEADRQPAGREP